MIRRSWYGGASIKQTLELWALSLRDGKSRLRPLFSQERGAVSAGLFLARLPGDARRRPDGCERRRPVIPVPGGSRPFWGMGVGTRMPCDVVRDYAVEHLRGADTVLVIDETGFLKQGKASGGV